MSVSFIFQGQSGPSAPGTGQVNSNLHNPPSPGGLNISTTDTNGNDITAYYDFVRSNAEPLTLTNEADSTVIWSGNSEADTGFYQFIHTDTFVPDLSGYLSISITFPDLPPPPTYSIDGRMMFNCPIFGSKR